AGSAAALGREGVRHRVRHRGAPAADGGARRQRPGPRRARRRPVRPDRADAPVRADPDLRRRHERGAARHHRRRGPGTSRRPEKSVNFTQNESQRELAALSRRILTDRLTPERLASVEAGAEAAGDRFDPALWASLAGAGILAAGLPESVGGAGLGLLEQCSVLTELGRAVAPVPYLASIVL